MERIICIDDDPLCLLLEEMVIKQANIADETLLADSGSAAFSLLNKLYSADNKHVSLEEPSTLIFLDINMPVMNGWDFLGVFEEKYQHLFGKVKIVILSSSIDTEDIIKSRQYKTVSNFISKPLTVEVVNKFKGAIRA